MPTLTRNFENGKEIKTRAKLKCVMSVMTLRISALDCIDTNEFHCEKHN